MLCKLKHRFGAILRALLSDVRGKSQGKEATPTGQQDAGVVSAVGAQARGDERKPPCYTSRPDIRQTKRAQVLTDAESRF
jgi:hypothetical protein